jgi:hypothetical protein
MMGALLAQAVEIAAVVLSTPGPGTTEKAAGLPVESAAPASASG